MNENSGVSELFMYLKSIKETNLELVSDVHFAVGNESTDLDSVVSSVMYSFFLSQQISKEETNKSVSLPLIWCDKDDIVLRTEVVALFKRYSLPLDSLLYKDDWPDLKKKVADKNIEVTLIDHNNGREHKDLNPFVTAIIDHHKDPNEFTTNVSKQIEFVGSCSTLIAERIRKTDIDFLESFPDVSEMLLATILIDTYNLNTSGDRTTEKDITIADILAKIKNTDTEELFNTIQKAKADLFSMSTFDILRKDYKPVQKNSKPSIGISAATMKGNILLLRQDFIETSKRFMNEKNLDVLIVMFLYFENNDTTPNRQIVIVTPNYKLGEQLCDFMIGDPELKMVENELELSKELAGISKFYNHNRDWSRKKVLPFVNTFVI